MQTLGQLLKESRVKAGLSQKDVSNTLGYSTSQFISNWERGVSQPPIAVVKKLGVVYKMNPEVILESIIQDTVSTVKKEITEKFNELR